jgi:hypothetical protein
VAAKPPLLLLRRGIETMIEATMLPGRSCEAGYTRRRQSQTSQPNPNSIDTPPASSESKRGID